MTVLSTDELSSGPAAAASNPHQHSDDALALLIYTSGTTGRPKGVMLDHANLNAMCRMAIDAFKMTSDDHSLLILPLFHVNGIVVGTLSPLVAGGRATIAGRFSPKTFFDRLEKSRATYFSAVPTIYTMLSDLPADVRARHVLGQVRDLRRRTGKRRVAEQVRDAATASRSSRATGCPRDRVPAPSTRSTACARPAPWGFRCRGRRFGSSTPTTRTFRPVRAGEVLIQGPTSCAAT